ncbi:MAG: TrkA C-terminal domain-containing protein [Anaeroplasma sp.]|uniref:TrkA C-terminal domain-containing protein n=1 Tax=Anaeroplasma sp. TaxID=1872523 RepID=UPI002A909D80|nr:TrkA C-terminal domain-containing protein [Anaeroplasma sp.]MDY5983662.1 TrkA C-terminal domain-containing protein [Anaeroplasma sp.]
MDLMTSVILIMVFIIIYVILIEIFSMLFRITGLTKEKASFQAISLLTNCGFTTGESEVITSDRLRRRIAIAAMISGYSFSVVIVSLLINVFMKVSTQSQEDNYKWIFIAFGIFILLLIITQIPIFKRLFEKLIGAIAHVVLRRNNSENIITLLDNYGKDAMVEVYLNRVPEFMVDTTVVDSKIKDKYKINILMCKRNGKIIDVTKDTIFKKKDSLVIFGSFSGIKNCFTKKVKETKKNVIELIEEYGDEVMTEIQLNQLPEFLKDKGLYESGLKLNYNINLLTIKRKEQFIPIQASTMLQKGDTIVVFGSYQRIKEAFASKNQDEIGK